jgi:hypothetical protein
MHRIALDNLRGKFYSPLMAKKPKITPSVQDYMRQISRLGGKARAQKYDKATLSKWARKGGRPPKAKGKT